MTPASPSADALQSRFTDAVTRVEVSCGDTIVVVQKGRAREILKWLRDDPGQQFTFLTDVTAVEFRDRERPLELVYQLWSIPRRAGLRVKIELDKTQPLVVDSVTGLWNGANWLEREVWDMFGIKFTGHPDLRRILMWENYSEGHPLRKDFPLRGRFSRSEQVRRTLSIDLEGHYSKHELSYTEAQPYLPEEMRQRYGAAGLQVEATATAVAEEGELKSDHMLVNIGPQHPATHGVLRLVVELDGEVVVKVVPHIGYLHSGFEKMGEYRQYNQIIPLTDRTDYLAAMSNNVGFALAAEKLMGIQVTERCQVLRVIACEMARIMSHLVWAGTTGIDVGAFTVFLWMFQERERLYNFVEAWTGARMTTSLTRVGGLMADIPDGWADGLKTWCRRFPSVLDEVETMLSRNNIWLGRNVDVGVISREDAINWSLTGPMLRSTGVDYDVRKDRPYLGYDTYDFEVAVGEHGDCYDRYLCRMEEMRQSTRLILQALERLPEGPINVSDPRVILPSKTRAMSDMEAMIFHFKQVMDGIAAPVGEAYLGIEGPRGELGNYLVSDGSAKPVRWRIRPPAMINLAALPLMSEGHLLSDLIAINASVDIVMGEVDR